MKLAGRESELRSFEKCRCSLVAGRRWLLVSECSVELGSRGSQVVGRFVGMCFRTARV